MTTSWDGVVTLGSGVKSPARRARARAIAARLGVPLLGSTDPAARRARATYAVSEARERIRFPDGAALEPHPGLLGQKLQTGHAHPLAMAMGLRPERPLRLLDGTAGLGQDSLHFAALGAEVLGAEANPALGLLLEGALQRWRRAGGPWSAAAGRVRMSHRDLRGALAGLPPGAVDAVFLDPMFEDPRPAGPGYDVFRREASPAPLRVDELERAVATAGERVVVKVPAGCEPRLTPSSGSAALARLGFNRRICSRAFDYWIVESVLALDWQSPKRGRDPYPRPPRDGR